MYLDCNMYWFVLEPFILESIYKCDILFEEEIEQMEDIMGEKIKDLVYDFSDIILSLVIITIIFTVVSWKVSDSMNYNSLTDQAEDAAIVKTEEKKPNAAAPTDSTVKIDTSAAANPPQVSGTDGKPSAGAAPTGNSTPAPSATTPATTPPPSTNVAPATGSDFQIVVPPGSSGYSIARQLKEKGIITDTKMFITRVEQLKMGSKLKAGTFTIKSGSTLDEVIYTLTGKK